MSMKYMDMFHFRVMPIPDSFVALLVWAIFTVNKLPEMSSEVA